MRGRDEDVRTRPVAECHEARSQGLVHVPGKPEDVQRDESVRAAVLPEDHAPDQERVGVRAAARCGPGVAVPLVPESGHIGVLGKGGRDVGLRSRNIEGHTCLLTGILRLCLPAAGRTASRDDCPPSAGSPAALSHHRSERVSAAPGAVAMSAPCGADATVATRAYRAKFLINKAKGRAPAQRPVRPRRTPADDPRRADPSVAGTLIPVCVYRTGVAD